MGKPSALLNDSEFRVAKRVPIGLKDRAGRDIYTGDIVEYYFDADLGYSLKADTRYTRMRDVVIVHDRKPYFVCASGGAYAWRHVHYCKVIGRRLSLMDT